MNITTNDENETIKAAQSLAADITRGSLIFLRGNLGAGKTVFARALIRALSRDDTLEVPSPTFTLVQSYDTDQGPLWHFDFYRLKNPAEIYELGWDEALQDIVIAEWPERLEGHIPARYLDIRINSVENEPDKREIHITRVE